MADLDREERDDATPAKAPRPRRALPKTGGGGMGMIAGWALALAAIAVAAFLFMQLNTLKRQLADSAGPTPRGVAGQEDSQAAGAENVNVDDWQAEAQQVIYELGKFTTNTVDGRHAQLDVALLVESYYRQEEWDAYAGQMQAYEEQMKAYLQQQKGTPAEGEQAAIHTGAIPAVHGAPKDAAPAPVEKPTLPERPLTRLERELQKEDSMVRDAFIKRINATSAADFVSEQGKQQFKQAVIDELNAALPTHAGTIIDIYFRDLVTT